MTTARKTHQSFLYAVAVAVVLAALPSTALAQRGKDKDKDKDKDKTAEATESGEDDSLFNCQRAKRKFSITLKPDVELKDLITWAMGFTCKNFVYSSGIGGRSAKVTILSPEEMSPQQAWLRVPPTRPSS